jgi:hypothetical protein
MRREKGFFVYFKVSESRKANGDEDGAKKVPAV